MKIRIALEVVVVVCVAVLLAGCSPKIKLFTDAEDPLREQVIQGEGEGKILLIDLAGFITDEPSSGLLGQKPSPVQDLVSRLRIAEKDEDLGAVVIKINSPGGTITASDIIYNEIMKFREKTGKPVIAALMDVAASGGYYAALGADEIMAHPTTVTGSVGVIFFLPKVYGLMDMIGVEVEVAKSGRNKDMGSPFRKATDEEKELMAGLIDQYAGRFLDLLRTRRHPGDKTMELAATARIFTGPEAQKLGLVDSIGYLDDAFAKAAELGNLGEDPRVVAYRRGEYPNDNPYNMGMTTPVQPAMINLDAGALMPRRAGFYYLWLPASE